MKTAKESASSMKSASTTKGKKGTSIAAKNASQQRGRTTPKGAGHTGSSSSAGRKSSTSKSSAKK